MARFGLIGPSYTSQSLSADSEMTMNWYHEQVESQGGKSAYALYGTPGLTQFNIIPLGGPSVPNMFSFNGRLFAISGQRFVELFADGSNILRGLIPILAITPVSIAANQNQLLMAASGQLFVFTFKTNAFTPVPLSTFPALVIQVAYSDGFFLALLTNSNIYYQSNLLDGTTWNALATGATSVFPDNVLAMIVAFREPLFFGAKQSVAYQNTGDFPLSFDQAVPGGFMEQGIIAPFSVTVMDNSVWWLGGDTRGAGIVWRLNGYTPTRVSNHAIEFAIQGYSTISDAVSYAYQDQGHTFYVLYFPTANATWVYDAATGQWHQRGFWNGMTWTAHRSMCHAYAFGQHLVGDWATGNVYVMDINTFTDFGSPIVRQRISPIISSENEWLFHTDLTLDIETGLGPQPPLLDGRGKPRGPQIMMSFSDDSGHTWSSERIKDCGQAGDYEKRVVYRRLGRSRNRVYKIRATDPVPYRIIEGYLKASPGFERTERISKQYAKVS